jgi:hypothetical protein
MQYSICISSYIMHKRIAGKEQAMSLIDNEHQIPEGLGYAFGMDMDANEKLCEFFGSKQKGTGQLIEGSATGDEAKEQGY